jgi:hypothetical protein
VIASRLKVAERSDDHERKAERPAGGGALRESHRVGGSFYFSNEVDQLARSNSAVLQLARVGSIWVQASFA